jgi:hypothetical protein
MTIQEQFMVTQTEVMRQLLQTQQQLAQQLQNNPHWETSMASSGSPHMSISMP